MARKTDKGLVRPLGESTRRQQPPHLPALMAIALLAAGGMAGFFFGLPGDTTGPGTPVTDTPTVASSAPLITPLHYQWLQPATRDAGQAAWAVHAAVELEDDIFLLVSDDPDSALSRALWRSHDGERWEPLSLDLGAAAQVTDLDVHGQSLLLSGWDGTTPTVWRSRLREPAAGLEWIAMPLASDLTSVGTPVVGLSVVTTVVNPQGGTVTIAQAGLSLEEELLGLTSDPRVASLLHFAEHPEVAVSGGRMWMRVVTGDGEETVHTNEIPSTVGVAPISGHYGTDIPALQAWAMWESRNGSEFTPRVLPTELTNHLRPMPLGDGFVATTENDLGTIDLWMLTDQGWNRNDRAVPAECGGWRNTATDGRLLLTISDSFDTVCISEDGSSWVVQESPTTAVSSQATVWIEGAREGFIAVAHNTLEYAVLTSNDGLGWTLVNSVPDVLGSLAYRVGDRLVATARPAGGMTPLPVVVWVGAPADE